MKSLRFILAVILITVLTGSSALADASTESEAEDALTYLGRELEATAKHLSWFTAAPLPERRPSNRNCLPDAPWLLPSARICFHRGRNQ